MTELTWDLAVVGGGLAGSLVALAFAHGRPDLRLVLVEAGERIGGDHIWSFFESDLAEAERALLDPLVAARWSGYDVCFPGYTRTLDTAYASVTSARLDSAIRARLPGCALRLGVPVTALDPQAVYLADGARIAARAVIDARGAHGLAHMTGGWQTFLGQMIETARPHGITRPVVMDARVRQQGGYRFVYLLPFSPTRIFVEDTYYADRPAIDRDLLRCRIADYASDHGWDIAEVVYEETGALPVIARGDFAAFWNAGAAGRAVARAGVRAALVHPLTSYSLPDAARFAVHLSRLDKVTAQSLGRVSHEWAAHHWRNGRFYRMLSTMLFGAAQPHERWRMLARFYRLPAPLIERFYAGRSSLGDRVRILAGKPPVPVGAALAALAGKGRALADLAPHQVEPSA
ncbi:lycopene beta-cyclase CrtY [Novosphingobium sp. 1949]|uniref:Lycopene beta-cyclase CrtY n=1 Tax=Novosphingobium organovorum TaxID=2930092 RepID=A0ABT0BGF9_9SPHN|nr:lycopene beta-cyclase CrtY [Novosphingobium organovorum]MCJ2184147.1 lycopene beta-cyclase CrtY [Novosphingobium organovorum]